MSLTIFELAALKDEELHDFLVQCQLVPAEGTYTCPSCHSGNLQLQHSGNRVEEWRWHCPAKIAKPKKKPKPCGKICGYKTGTIFQRSQLSIVEIIGFVQLWVHNTSLNSIADLVGISKAVAIEWAKFCRQVVYQEMVQTRQPLGGPGITVEIDDAVFGRRSYHEGQEVGGQRVFGGYERGTGRVFLVPLERRDSETLVSLILKWVLPGSIIISGITDLAPEDYEQLTLNHTITFVDLASGVNVNAMVATWRAVKAVPPSPNQFRKAHVPSILARYIFYKHCRELKLNRTCEFLRLAGRLYNPLRPWEETSILTEAMGGPLVEENDVEEDLDFFDDLLLQRKTSTVHIKQEIFDVSNKV